MSLDQNISQRRKQLKLSQEYIAEQLGVSRQAVSKWETGQSEPTAKNLVELAQLFNVTVSELVEPKKVLQITEELDVKQKKRMSEIFAIIAYTGSIIMWTFETNERGYIPYVNTLIFISAILMAINIFRLPSEVRAKMARKELLYCIVLYCLATFLNPVIKNVFTCVIILICCVIYIKYIRFGKDVKFGSV